MNEIDYFLMYLRYFLELKESSKSSWTRIFFFGFLFSRRILRSLSLKVDKSKGNCKYSTEIIKFTPVLNTKSPTLIIFLGSSYLVLILAPFGRTITVGYILLYTLRCIFVTLHVVELICRICWKKARKIILFTFFTKMSSSLSKNFVFAKLFQDSV